jgi:hypothetical protein
LSAFFVLTYQVDISLRRIVGLRQRAAPFAFYPFKVSSSNCRCSS